MMNVNGLFFLLFIFISFSLKAGVIVESSRIVYSESNREQSLMLANGNSYPVIVQCWIDNGDPDGSPETAGETPILPLPGIFRLEPGEKKVVRLLATGIEQPKDRESLYWLNIYELTPNESFRQPEKPVVKVAIRLQIKVFYRPTSIKNDDNDDVEFHLSNKETGSVYVENKSPRYITFSKVEISGAGRSGVFYPGMVSPFSKIKVNSGLAIFKPNKVKYTVINDDGNEVIKISDIIN